MRIAIVLKTFPPDAIGGMETQTKQMALELTKAGHDVTVFTKQFTQHDDSGLPYEVVRVWNWQYNSFISDLTFLMFCLIKILRRDSEFDVLQCMMIYPTGFLGYVVSKLTNLPYFAWIRGGDYYLMNDVYWKRWMMRRVLKDTLVLVQSEEIQNDVVNDFQDIDCTIEVLGNAVSIPDETADGKGVLYVGRLAPKKGVEHLIEAMTEVDAQLTIVGSGPEYSKLKSLADRKNVAVTFEGEVNPCEVHSYYQSASVFVLPSLEGEGMPNVVLEAMANGLPVIGTNSGGVPTLIDDNSTGYIVPMGDSDSLQKHIKQLLDDQGKRESMGNAARQYIQTNRSWNSIIEELEYIYNRMVD